MVFLLLMLITRAVAEEGIDDVWLMPDTRDEAQEYEILSFIQENSRGLGPYWDEDKGWALGATKNITLGEGISVMNPEFCMSSFDYFPLKKYVFDAPEEIKLMARLVYERLMSQGKTFQSKYVNMYPKQVYCQANWTNAEREFYNDNRVFEIDFKPSVDYASAYNKWIAELELKSDREDDDKFPPVEEVKKWEAWKWAYCTYTARATQISKENWQQVLGFKPKYADRFEEGYVIVPFFDMVNHAPLSLKGRDLWKNETIAIDANAGLLYLYADRDVQVGSEVSRTYGSKINPFFLQNHGFVLDKNLDDAFPYAIDSANNCLGMVFNGKCEYRMTPIAINTQLLDYFHLSKEGKYMAFLEYRRHMKELISTTFKKPLRVLRKKLDFETDYMRRTFVRSAIAEEVLVYEHLKLLERAAMQETFSFLKMI